MALFLLPIIMIKTKKLVHNELFQGIGENKL